MTAGKGIIRADQQGIGSVLRLYRLTVPPNQRDYAWEEDHVEDLFQDFAGAIDSDKPSYFLGTIVLTQGESGLLEVSDGQQRLATTSILLAAMRDHFISTGEDELAQSLENDFLFTYDREARCRVPKLTLNVDDRQFFLNRILARPSSPERKEEAKRDSHRKIDFAAKIAAKLVRELLAPLRAEHTDSSINKATIMLPQVHQQRSRTHSTWLAGT